MTCFVIGGAGFIGRSLVRLLVRQGRDVAVVGRSPDAARVLPAAVRYVRWNPIDPSALATALAGATEVIDLTYASAARATFSDPMAELLANVPVSLAVMQAALTANVRRYVYVSSGGTVYGEQAVRPIAETAIPAPVSAYGITKLTIERYALLHWHHHHLPAVIVRPGNAYGAEQQPFTGQGFIATAVGSALQRKPITVFGERGTVRDYVHVDDVSSAIVAALEHAEVGRVYNVGSGVGLDNVDVLEVIRRQAAASGYELQVQFAPARPADVTSNVLDASALERVSGWRPQVAFEAGIRDVWQAQQSRQQGGA